MENHLYKVGTLTYNRRSLAWLFFWLLLGDFTMKVAAGALSRLLPLQLDHIGIKPSHMGWVLSLGPLASLGLSPFIGIWSDRLRTSWGRRRPFLICSTPVAALGLILIPHVTNYVLLCGVVFVVQIAGVLETVLFYLYADIIPPTLMARFMAAFTIVGTMGGLAFNYFLIPLFGQSPILTWTICGVSYLVLYQLSLLFLKEGSYPPPEKETPIDIVKDYLKDGAGSRYIWLLWGALGTIAVTTPAGYFTDLFSKNELKLSLTDIGHMTAYATLPALILMYPCGWLIDRVGPRIIWGSGSVAVGITNLLAYLFVYNAHQMLLFYIVSGIFQSLLSVAIMPMLYTHLPKNKFGQLVSTQSVVVQALIFLSTNGVTQFIGAFGNNYRMALLYAVPFFLMTPLFLFFIRLVPNPFIKEDFVTTKPEKRALSHAI